MPVREPSVTEVKSELQSILSSREFRQSKGLSRLLRYICGKALIGDTEPVTEYTIAVDVLGKPQDFKESKDAGVRVEVHRLRKRLGEFYQNEGSTHRVRIFIPTGHYVPEFVMQGEGSSEDADSGAELAVIAPPMEEPPVVVNPPEPLWEPSSVTGLASAPAQTKPLWRLSPKVALWIFGVASLVLAASLLARPEDALDSLWRPVVSSRNPILLVVGDMAGGHNPALDPPDQTHMTVLDFHGLKSQSLLLDDAATMTRFAGLLQAKGKPYRVVSQSEATFADLQSGPAVLIGLANNDWTERLVGKLRSWVQHTEPGGKLILRDREHPERADWSVDYSAPLLGVTKDYALVMRVLDPKTEQVVISAAGIAVFGTLAAGDFLTNPDEFRKIEAVAPRGWRKMNFEMVLSTDVIKGKSGHANIVAYHFW